MPIRLFASAAFAQPDATCHICKKARCITLTLNYYHVSSIVPYIRAAVPYISLTFSITPS
jgi:hypothetical protein